MDQELKNQYPLTSGCRSPDFKEVLESIFHDCPSSAAAQNYLCHYKSNQSFLLQVTNINDRVVNAKMTIKNTNWLIVVVHFILVRETSCSFSALETTTPPINFTKRIELAASTQATPVKPENGSSSVAVETRHEVKSTCKYCWTNEPKRTVISNLLRLRMRSLAENNTLFHDYCRTSLYRRNEAAAQYYQLVYLRFCDVSSYNGICNDPKSEYHPVDIDSIVRWWLRYNNVSFTTQGNGKFEDTTSGSQPTISDVYCKQISSYFTTLITGYEPMWSNMSLLNDSNRNKTFDFGFPFANPLYKEVHVRSPDFCKSIYCGFALSNGKVTPHARIGCYPTSCRTGEIASIVMYAVLSPIVVVANLLVLVVAVKTDLLKNIPGYFKIQLAVADLLIGAVVLPGVVYQHYSEYFKPLPWSYKGDSTSNIVTSSEYSKQYLNAMGIISVLSLVVSVSTLCAASIDRYLAISKPFRYIQGSNFMTKVTSLILCSVWIAGLLCSLLPLSNHSQYTFFDNGLFFAQDGLSLVIVGALMGLVLLGTWVINGMTIFCVGKHFSTRRRTLKIQRTGRTSTSHCDGDGNRISVLSRNKTMSKVCCKSSIHDSSI